MSTKPTGMIVEEELKEIIVPPPESQDPDALAFYIERLNWARDERSAARKEFDGLTFEQDFARNREVAFSYLRAKKNDDDVRVNSGTAEKKVELMLNELLSMNFQPEVRAYDKHDFPLHELSVEFTDIVRKTNDQEHDDDMYQELYLDILTQRIAILEERVEEKEYTNNYSKEYACKRRISPLQFYVADIYLPAYRLQDQPYIVLYDRMLYSEAKALLGENPNFEYVRPGTNVHEEYAPYFKYRFSSLEDKEVEVITYISRADNEYQVIVNGVMMYEPGHEMETKMYPFVAVTVKSIPDFFYGKPPIASARYLQAVTDETMRNLIVKMRQAIRPPLGVPAGKVYSRDIWSPGAQTQGLIRENFSPLISHNGVTPAEFQMLNLFQAKVEEFIGASSTQQQPGSQPLTATQIIAQQREMVKMLGLSVLAVIRMKRDATMLRLNSLFEIYMESTVTNVNGKNKNTYRSFYMQNGRNTDGQTIQKYITFIDRNLSEKELLGVQAKEKEEEMNGNRVQYTYINVAALKRLPLDFSITVNPESRDSSALDKVLFQDRLSQAVQVAQVAGRQLNADKLVEDFERAWKVTGLFEKPDVMEGTVDPAVSEQAKTLLGKIDALQPQQNGPAGTAPAPGQNPVQPPVAPAPQAQEMRKTLTNIVKQ